MNKQKLDSLRWRVVKVQALIKAVELSQRGIDTDESKEVGMCMMAAHHLLESIHGELAQAQHDQIRNGEQTKDESQRSPRQEAGVADGQPKGPRLVVLRNGRK